MHYFVRTGAIVYTDLISIFNFAFYLSSCQCSALGVSQVLRYRYFETILIYSVCLDEGSSVI